MRWKKLMQGAFEWSLVFFMVISFCSAQDLCRTASSSQSCNKCKENSQCAWCADPAFIGDFRCDLNENLHQSCPAQYLYQDKSQAKITENIPAGTYEPKFGKIRQMEPQQLYVLIKPGDTVTFPVKYYHSDHSEMDTFITSSNIETSGVTLKYHVNCKGILQEGQHCNRVQNAETVSYNVSVTIRDCNTNAAISVGIPGTQELVALYVRPQCECDCESVQKQEIKSGHCNHEGTLSCGQCICDDPKRGGRRCECELPEGTTNAQMEAQCKESPEKSTCSGHGYCSCGACSCHPVDKYTGQYCQVEESPECPHVNNILCSGHGSCSYGKCHCYQGWTGTVCECSTSQDACKYENRICSDHGTCVCEKCQCQQDYDGQFCERSLSAPISSSPPHPSEEHSNPSQEPLETEPPVVTDGQSPATDATDSNPETGTQSPVSEPEPEKKDEKSQSTIIQSSIMTFILTFANFILNWL